MSASVSASAILDRLASIRAKAATVAPTPLHLYLSIYLKAGRESYIDHMHGARALYHHLKPIALPTDVPPISPRLMDALSGYETLELAKIVSGYGTEHHNTLSLYNTHKAILYSMHKRMEDESYE